MKYLAFIFAFILMLSLVNAASPFISTSSSGIAIEQPYPEAIRLNENYKFHFHIFNQTNGKPFINSSSIECVFHLYNKTGNHIVKVNSLKPTGEDIYDYEILVTGNNFSVSGIYPYVFQCNDSSIGGFYENSVLVNAQGKLYTTIDGLVYIGIITILLVIFLIGFYSSMAIPFNNPRNNLNEIINIDYKKHIKLFAIVMTYMSFVSLTYFAWNLSYGILEFPEMAQWFYVLFRISFVIMIGFIPVVFVIGLIQVFKDNKLKTMMDRGLRVK